MFELWRVEPISVAFQPSYFVDVVSYVLTPVTFCMFMITTDVVLCLYFSNNALA